jgi:hypothetical protein
MVQTGQIGHSVEACVKKHHHHIWLHHPENSEMAEHSDNPLKGLPGEN